MAATVLVIGGGYGGVAVAKALDDVADVVLVEPRDAFVHNIAALRELVDPDWSGRLFFPYGRLLSRGRIVRDRAVRVDGSGVELASDERIVADYLVLATGSRYPFPAKPDLDDSTAARARFRAAHGALTRADGVLLLGAGPAGLELAGEIKAAWPGKRVTVVDPAEDILAGGFVDDFRAELRAQLAALDVELVLGTALREEPPSEPGETRTFTVTTRSGREITADLWFRCFGVVPVSDCLTGELAPARRRDGHVEVTGELRLPGQRNVFAVGDVTALPEAKLAKAAGEHAAVVAHNIGALIRGSGDLTTYTPAPPAISLPLGPHGGASYAPGRGVLGAEATSRLKGADLRVGSYTELFGLD
ncbi:FAD-dependent oxidoreductase [Streptomyces nanshensis]|uniref:Pyridine nucleotide-disulfide oxidoreductase n=1 Tax=Streptomyces nanshensis TaxID=518642 RepID=A0A1E7L9K6_9ACTN|nr:FAD-dependent oxidoreductase [Streptomyces nanshensis]OEV12844.1 pyridine nucleotide-disulfide oxidoreductase [Streptomyces nanshensis]